MEMLQGQVKARVSTDVLMGSISFFSVFSSKWPRAEVAEVLNLSCQQRTTLSYT